MKNGRGYMAVILPEHPKADSKGRVTYHRVLMENQLGRLLLEDEVVHHKNGDPTDNRIENLEVLLRSEHGQHHARYGKSLGTFKCAFCGKVVVRESRRLSREHHFCTRSCGAQFYWASKAQPTHGTNRLYKRGCKCAECRKAHAATMRAYRQRRVS